MQVLCRHLLWHIPTGEYLVNRGAEVGEHGTCKVAGDHLTKVKDLCAVQTIY